MNGEPKALFASTFNFLGGISGLISIVIIIWKGGALNQKVESHETRIGNIEQTGSIGLREHVKGDDERVADMRLRETDMALRITHQEELTAKLTELFGDVKVINVKLDALKEQITVKIKP